MDLPESRARSLLREGVVQLVDDPVRKPKSASTPVDKPDDSSEDAEPKPRRPRKPKTEE